MSKYHFLGAALVAVQLSCAAHAHAELPAFEFRGHVMGESAEKVSPYYSIDQSTCWKHDGWGRSVIDSTKCPADIESKTFCSHDSKTPTFNCYDIPIRTGGEIGGVHIYELKYGIYDGKLYSMNMTFGSADFAKVSDMLTGKYGKPIRGSTPTFQTRAGATYTNVVFEWDFEDGTLIEKMLDGRIDVATLKFQEKAVADKINDDLAKSAEETGRAAF